jgi:excisionase family DNA binding protein
VNLDDLDGQNFTGVPEAAEILGGCDPRTVRAEIRAGRIPAIRVGTRWIVPVAWLRK